MIFLDDSLGNWLMATNRRELLNTLPHRPGNKTLTLSTLAAAGLAREPIDAMATSLAT